MFPGETRLGSGFAGEDCASGRIPALSHLEEAPTCPPAASLPTPFVPCRWMPSRRPIRAIPGAPMGLADIAEVLWRDVLKFNPGKPGLVGPRPLRAVERPRIHAAVFRAASHRLSPVDRGAEEFSAVRLEDARAIRSASCTSASRPRPGRSARASRMRWGWRLRSARSPRPSIGRATRSSITIRMHSSAMAA